MPRLLGAGHNNLIYIAPYGHTQGLSIYGFNGLSQADEHPRLCSFGDKAKQSRK